MSANAWHFVEACWWPLTCDGANCCCVPCRSLTRSTTPHGIALSGGTLAAMWRTRRSISSTSTWAKWLSYCSSQAEIPKTCPPKTTFNSALNTLCHAVHLLPPFPADMLSFWFPARFSLLLFATYNPIGGWRFSHAWTGDVPFIENANVKLLPMPALSQPLHIWQTHHDS